jgi:hypothetical protein
VIQTATDNGSRARLHGQRSSLARSTTRRCDHRVQVQRHSGQRQPDQGVLLLQRRNELQIPQIHLNVRQSPVEAIPRRLKALWSSEAAEDLRAFHGVDAETEMVAVVAQEIALEIDREIIQDLFKNATGTTATFDRVPPAGINDWTTCAR